MIRKNPSPHFSRGWFFVWAALLFFLPEQAHAQALEGLICDLVELVRDDIGTAVCTVAVMILGWQAALGRVPWALPFVTAAGIVVLYSAGDIAEVITGSSAC